jgi:8-oxo-dGTP diphosphatase
VTQYVLGFLFHGAPLARRVALIRKAKPDFQRGKLNGIGGKIEPGESAYEAQIREFKEETGHYAHAWNLFCIYQYEPTYEIFCFWSDAFGERAPFLEQTTDEEPNWYYLRAIEEENLMSSVSWLARMANFDRGVIRTIRDHAS